MRLPVVAIIGQTNAGKSSLFNRLVRKSQAIVAREEGTTRDNVMGRVDDRYVLIDTAGLKDAEDEFESHIQDQIEDAVEAAAHAKKFGVRIAEHRLRECMQLLGARGLRASCPIGRHLVGARIANYVDGTTEMQNERIAASLLRRLSGDGEAR